MINNRIVMDRLKAFFTPTHIIFVCACTLVISLMLIPGCKKNTVVKSYDTGNTILAFTLDSGQVNTAAITIMVIRQLLF
jgi:hypothetical protein